MESLSFIRQYFLKPRTVGAVLPSSKYLAKKMIDTINFDRATCIVEYGPGTGVFTDKILQKRKPGTLVVLFETNGAFCQNLKGKYSKETNLVIINDSARNIAKHFSQIGLENADYIVSGLPFASLPQDIAENILRTAKKHLKPKGVFITFQYTLLKRSLLSRFFDNIEIEKEWRNIPPAYVLRCQ